MACLISPRRLTFASSSVAQVLAVVRVTTSVTGLPAGTVTEAGSNPFSVTLMATRPLSAALVCDPELLILDEPTTALDPETRDGFYALLRELNRERGVAIVLITHDTWNIGRHAERFHIGGHLL